MNKRRHWILTITLIVVGLANILLATSYLLLPDHFLQSDQDITLTQLSLLGLVSIINVGCVTSLFFWKKLGVLGFAITSLAKFFINYEYGTRFPELFLSFVGLIVIIVALQFKVNQISGWKNLD